jgi:hypothetical protein
LLQQYTDIERLFNALLAQDLNAFSARIAQEQRRIQGLRDYIHAVPREKPFWAPASSAKSCGKLCDQAAATLKPVVLQGPPGTGKTFLAGLIHSRSGLADQPFVELDCAKLPHLDDGRLDTDLLFGRVGESPGLIALLERGTLLLSNVQVLMGVGDAPGENPASATGTLWERLIHYLQTGNLLPNPSRGDINSGITAQPQPMPILGATHAGSPWHSRSTGGRNPCHQAV